MSILLRHDLAGSRETGPRYADDSVKDEVEVKDKLILFVGFSPRSMREVSHDDHVGIWNSDENEWRFFSVLAAAQTNESRQTARLLKAARRYTKIAIFVNSKSFTTP